METMSIAESFRNGTVLITGSTGFLGKVLIEKLLRSCPVKNIAVLVRNKKGHNANQRIMDMFKQAFFDVLRREKPDFMNNIKIIIGNLEEPSMGLESSDREWMIENINFVFHCAATIKFNESLELATKINIRGTENILLLATYMENLKGFVHVSTAYSHCPRNEIKEQYYPVPITDYKELEHMLGHDHSNILENWPNTYTFTKAITENLISTNDNQLPISIFRPSIIGCTNSEPEPGWLENMNGPTGIVTPIMVGFLRTIPIATEKITDIIPVDYTANALISVMWDTVNRHKDPNNSTTRKPKIYNYVSSVESPISWGTYIKEMHNCYQEVPPRCSMWYSFYIFYTKSWVGEILRFLLHRTPAAFIDFLLILSGKSPRMSKLYAKTDYLLDTLYEFTTRQWKFDNRNTRELWSMLRQEDRSMFFFSLEKFNWQNYIKSYYHGIRRHVLREDLSNIKEASAKNRKLFWLHHVCTVLIIYFIYQICRMLMRFFFGTSSKFHYEIQ